MVDREQVRAALEAHEPKEVPALPGRTNHLPSGVLVPLIFEGERLICIATLRAASLTSHANEVCFPGGRPEPGDDDIVQTALREAHEELGIEDAEILGPLSSIPLYTSDYRLRPWVAAIPARQLHPNPGEVAAVLRFDIREQLGAPHIDAIPWTHPETGAEHLSPLFTSGEIIMYGATAHTFHELLAVLAPLLGRSAPPPLKPGQLAWPDILARSNPEPPAASSSD